MVRSQQHAAIQLRDYKREAILGLAFGLIAGAGAKYLAVAVLILWLFAGGQ